VSDVQSNVARRRSDARLAYDVVVWYGVSIVLLGAALLVRYPAPGERERIAAAASVLSVAALIAWARWSRARAASDESALSIRTGVECGAIGGLIWIAEIAYNNFISPATVTSDVAALTRTRDRVDDVA
jgi:hypothetical protein